MKPSRAPRFQPLGVLAPLVLLASAACTRWDPADEGTVVVYVSEDQVFSEPILRGFEEATGLRVKAVYDTEEAKSTGVLNRLLAEAGNPQADVFWANEPLRAEVLARRGIAAPYLSPAAAGIPPEFKDEEGRWTGFSARLRVLLVRADLADPPRSIQALVEEKWRGRAVLANPLFGTTTVHAAALFAAWGRSRAEAFFARIKGNDVALSASNGESADAVAQGRCDFGLVDSDDAAHRMARGLPVRMIIPDQGEDELGCLVLPNAAVLIAGGPHPENGRRLIDYLLSAETERALALAPCAQVPLRPGVEGPALVPVLASLRVMRVPYAELAATLERIQPFLQQWSGY